MFQLKNRMTRVGVEMYESNNVRKLSLIRANWRAGNLNENPLDVEISECETNGTNDPAELSYYTLGKICTITFHIYIYIQNSGSMRSWLSTPLLLIDLNIDASNAYLLIQSSRLIYTYIVHKSTYSNVDHAIEERTQFNEYNYLNFTSNYISNFRE